MTRGRGIRSWRMLLAGSVLFALLTVAQTPRAWGSGPSYVAMGDSFTTGGGTGPAAEGSPHECGVSSASYPFLAAATLGLTLKDVSCGGASSSSFRSSQFPDQPPQFDALSASTEVVSVSMGGNDHG